MQNLQSGDIVKTHDDRYALVLKPDRRLEWDDEARTYSIVDDDKAEQSVTVCLLPSGPDEPLTPVIRKVESLTRVNPYYLISRPPGIGCQPNYATKREAWQPPQQIGLRHFWGVVEYEDPLPFEKIKRYELWDVSPLNRAKMVLENTQAQVVRGYVKAWHENRERVEKYAQGRDRVAWAIALIMGELEFDVVV